MVIEYNADGLRIDTVKHVRKDFWPGYEATAGVFCTGEVLHGGKRPDTYESLKVADGMHAQILRSPCLIREKLLNRY